MSNCKHQEKCQEQGGCYGDCEPMTKDNVPDEYLFTKGGHIPMSMVKRVIDEILACEDLEVNRKASYRVDGVEIPHWKVATKADIISKLGEST